MISYSEDGEILAQVAQRGFKTFIFEDTQDLSGCGPKQPAVAGPDGEVGPEVLRGSHTTYMFLCQR